MTTTAKYSSMAFNGKLDSAIIAVLACSAILVAAAFDVASLNHEAYVSTLEIELFTARAVISREHPKCPPKEIYLIDGRIVILPKASRGTQIRVTDNGEYQLYQCLNVWR